MDSSQQALQTNGMFFFFSNFKLVFELMAENRKIFKLIARREYWSKCYVLYINGFVLTSSTNKSKFFFLILNLFSNYWPKTVRYSFKLMAKNRKIFKQIARREYRSNFIVLYINLFVSTSSTNKWKSFFEFLSHFLN